MTEITIIKQQEILGRTFRVYGTKEEPLILAKDVAEWIEHSSITMMIKSIDEEEKLKVRPKKSSGLITTNNEYWFLTERGLYQVLANSRKAIAKELLEALDLGFKIKHKRVPKQTEFTFMLSKYLQEHISMYNTLGYCPTFVEEFRVGKYRLDYFFADYGIIVEYDEKAHKYRLEEDKNREQEIKKILGNGIKFIRVQEGKEFEGVIHIISELSKRFHESTKQDT